MLMLGDEAWSDLENDTGLKGKKKRAEMENATMRIEIRITAAKGNFFLPSGVAACAGAGAAEVIWVPQSWQNFESGSSSTPHLRQ